MDENNLNLDKNGKPEDNISVKTYFSVSMGNMMFSFLTMVISTRLFDFYENEIGLSTVIVTFIFIIYALISIVNNPLIGYFIDKPRKFWSKYGKRFLWIVAGGILWSLSFILLFTVPNLDADKDWILLTTWFLIVICIYSTCYTIYSVSYGGLIPDKFRSDEQRLRVSSIGLGLSVIGTLLAAVIPPMIIEYGNRDSFLTMAIIVSIIGVFLVIATIPGVREDQWMIDRILSIDTKKEAAKFSEMIKIALKHRNFIAYLCIFTAIQAMVLIMTASIPYLVRFVLNEEAIVESYLLGGFILSGFLSVPLWLFIAKKLGDFKKVLILGSLLTILFTIPLLFINSLVFAIIATALLGVGIIGINMIIFPMFGDIIDEATIKNKTRQESFYVGFRSLFGGVAVIIQAVSFGLIHIFMGFEPGSATQSPRAIFGLLIQVAIIPMIIMIIGLTLFWKFYDLTPEKKEQIQSKLKDLNL